jgi:hypothetical protein
MNTYAKRKLKYSRNENFNLLHYVKWDRIVTLTGAPVSGPRVTLSYLISTQHQEGKFQKRNVSRVTCLSKPITQQF